MYMCTCICICKQLIIVSVAIIIIVVAMNSKDRYAILGLCKILHFIKQPCNSVCLKKGLEMH